MSGRFVELAEKVADAPMIRLLRERAKSGVEIRILGKVTSRSGELRVEKLPKLRLHVRAILRDNEALFIGIGLAPFLLGNAPAAYQALGIMYLAIGFVRAISMVVDKSIMQSNTNRLIVEIIFGVILVM